MLLYSLRFCANAGVSSNGRTAVSGAVCEGSIPSTPARKIAEGNFSTIAKEII